MPIAAYDSRFGNKKGAASETLAALRKRYGFKRGTSIFYALANKRLKAQRAGKP